MTGAKFTSFIMYIILLITFLGLINMIFNLHRFVFYGEFLILLGMLLAAIIAAVGISNNMRWAWILLALFFAFAFIDMLFVGMILAKKPEFFLYLVVVIVIGFFISVSSIKPKKKEVAKEAEEARAEKTETRAVTKTFKPGKYIASKTGTRFHSPKCYWAKKINKGNVVWLESKEDAVKDGYKADTCVK